MHNQESSALFSNIEKTREYIIVIGLKEITIEIENTTRKTKIGIGLQI